MKLRRSLLVLAAVAQMAAVTTAAQAKTEPFQVEVVNEAGAPLPVTIESAPAEEPFLLQLSVFELAFQGNAISISQVTRVCTGATPECDSGGTYVVPAGKSLVIESVGVIARTPTVPTEMSAEVNLDVPASSGSFGFDLGPAARSTETSAARSWAATYPVTLRAPSGTTVRGGVVWDQLFSGLVEASVTISGRLVSAP